MPELTENEIKQISLKPSNFEKFFHDFLRKQYARRDELGVYCLTTLKDNILMWAHYSNNHKGFCLEFDHKGEFFGRAHPITYSKVMPKFNILNMTVGETYKQTEFFVNALLTKAEDWKYEDEWRIVYTPKEGGPGIHTFPEKRLNGVILGFQTCNQNRKNIIKWCKGRTLKPKLYLTKPKDEEFGLDIIPLDV